MYIDPTIELRKYGLTASPLDNPEEYNRQFKLAFEAWKRDLDLLNEELAARGTAQPIEHMIPTPTQSDCYGYEFTPFDADSYVREHCFSYIYGLVSETDMNIIKSDESLTYDECKEAGERLEYLAMMYY